MRLSTSCAPTAWPSQSARLPATSPPAPAGTSTAPPPASTTAWAGPGRGRGAGQRGQGLRLPDPAPVCLVAARVDAGAGERRLPRGPVLGDVPGQVAVPELPPRP